MRLLQCTAQLALAVVCMFGPLVTCADVVDVRLDQMVQENMADPWPDPLSATAGTRAWGLPCYALAALYANTNVATANTYIEEFYSEFPVPDSDTIDFDAYFKLHLMWRIYHDPAMNARLTPTARDNIEDMMWRWINQRSTLSDAGGSEWRLHDSENHDAMQKGSFLLAALGLKNAGAPYGPDATIADGHTIAEHLDAWTDYLERYFRARAREGINVEMACPIYAKYSIGVYYNIRDFAESAALRDIADQFITLYWADTACDWTLSGVRGGGETRCYKENYLRLGTQYSFHELLWGYGWHTNAGTVRTYNLIPAVSSYRVPEIVTACAFDSNRPNYLYSSRRWGRTSGDDAEGNHIIVFDSGNSNIRRDTYVTPDYTMGAITLDMNRDYLQVFDQNRMAGVFFASGVNDRVVVYGKGAGNNKSYADLSGVCRENCMVVQRDINANSSGNETLVFISQDVWDQRVETGGWLFTQSGDAYCALKPATGGYTSYSADRGFELQLGDKWAPVVVQMGQASNYVDFASFQASVQGNDFSYAGTTLDYTSEAGDAFTVYGNTKTTPRVNGVTVDLNPAKTYDSPYLSMVHGEDTATFSYGAHSDLVLDFSGPVETAITVLDTDFAVTTSDGSPGDFTYIAAGEGTRAGVYSKNFNAGATSDMLVVGLSAEKSTEAYTVSYAGTPMTQAVQSAAGSGASIFYLANPSASGTIEVDFSGVDGTVNGFGIGIASLNNADGAIVLHSVAANTGLTPTNSVDITTTVADTFVMVAGDANAAGGSVSMDSPLTTIGTDVDVGSSQVGFGYENKVAADSHTYSWTPDANERGIAAAAFEPAAPPTAGTLFYGK
jgi:hypothetical protein